MIESTARRPVPVSVSVSVPVSDPRRRPSRGRRPAAVACGLAAALLAAVAPAGAGPPGPVESWRQLTVEPFGFGMFEPTISADGSRIAFRTSADLAGANADGSFEVFVADVTTGELVQVTDLPAGTAAFTPLITPDGERVIFRSAFDVTGGGQADTFELWEADLETGTFRQVTDNPPNTPVFEPRLSGDGRFVVFTSRIDPVGRNGDGSLEVFRLDVATGETIQISDNAVALAQHPDVSGDGSRIVWSDRGSYDGTNPEGGLEIWLWDEDAGISSVTRQPGSGLRTELPRIDGAGERVLFVSLFDFSGQGAIGNKLFLAELATGDVTLLTNPGNPGGGEDYPDGALSPDGAYAWFESGRDLVGANPDANRELFAYEIATATLLQVTDTTGGVSLIQLSDDATRRSIAIARDTGVVAYRSEQDLDPDVVNGPDGTNLDLFAGLPPGFVLPCGPADVDGSGAVGLEDLLAVLAGWGPARPGAAADVDGDGTVGLEDLLAVLGAFDAPCP